MEQLADYVKTPPWEHQEDAFQFLHGREYGGLFADMGTGKSLVACGLIGYAYPYRTLIVCPKAMVSVWKRTIEEELPRYFPFELTGTIDYRIKSLRHYADRKWMVFIVNYEALTYGKMAAALMEVGFDFLLLDESHKIKTPTSTTTRVLTRLGQKATWRYILTGTPAADKPIDVFSQLRFLKSSLVGTAFGAFKARYAVIERGYNQASGTFYDQIVGYQNQEELSDLIYSVAFRVERDVLSLPESTDTVIPVHLPKKARKAYDHMLKESILALDPGVSSASNVLARLLRLQQITSGFLIPDLELGEDTRQPKQLLHSEKETALLDLLNTIGPEPVVVFYRFDPDSHSIASAVKKADGKRKAYFLNGNQNQLESWKTDPDGVIAIQLRSGSAGISTVHASKVVYFSHSYSLTDYEQSRSRSHRPGQRDNVSFYHLIARNTVDEVILEALRQKKTDTRHLIDELRKREQ